MTRSLNSKACSGNTLVLQPPEVQGTGISWQDNVHCFVGRWRCIADWLYASESDNYRVYYADLLHKLHLAIKEKRRGKLTQVPLLLHDNAPVHRSHVGQATTLEFGFEEMHHPPYSPDLAPNDYHLFPNLKQHLCGQWFSTDDELKYATKECLKEQSELFYFTGIE